MRTKHKDSLDITSPARTRNDRDQAWIVRFVFPFQMRERGWQVGEELFPAGKNNVVRRQHRKGPPPELLLETTTLPVCAMSASRARAAVSEDLEETRRLNEYEFGSDGRLPESIPLEQGFRAWRLHATSLILAIADLSMLTSNLPRRRPCGRGSTLKTSM